MYILHSLRPSALCSTLHLCVQPQHFLAKFHSSPFALGPKFSPTQRTPLQRSPLPPGIYRLHITLTPNNSFLNLTNEKGDTKILVTLGQVRKSNDDKSGSGGKTSYLSQVASADKFARQARDRGVSQLEIVFKGYNQNARAIIKALTKYKFSILSIKDETPIPFNGTKPKKQRRI